jgi:hypothetical protein
VPDRIERDRRRDRQHEHGKEQAEAVQPQAHGESDQRFTRSHELAPGPYARRITECTRHLAPGGPGAGGGTSRSGVTATTSPPSTP